MLFEMKKQQSNRRNLFHFNNFEKWMK